MLRTSFNSRTIRAYFFALAKLYCLSSSKMISSRFTYSRSWVYVISLKKVLSHFKFSHPNTLTSLILYLFMPLSASQNGFSFSSGGDVFRSFFIIWGAQ